MKLKPCPFCGSEPECEIVGDGARPESVTISCQNASCPVNVYLEITTLDVDAVKRRWNTRAEEPAEKTAHWDINTDGFYPFCSHCGEAAQHMSPFCPNCGYRLVTRKHGDD